MFYLGFILVVFIMIIICLSLACLMHMAFKKFDINITLNTFLLGGTIVLAHDMVKHGGVQEQEFIRVMTIASALYTFATLLINTYKKDFVEGKKIKIEQDRDYLRQIVKTAERCLNIRCVKEEEDKYRTLEKDSSTYNVLLDVSISFGEVVYKREKGVVKLYLIKEIYERYEKKEFNVPYNTEIVCCTNDTV